MFGTIAIAKARLLKTDLQKVRISNVSGYEIVGFYIPTVFYFQVGQARATRPPPPSSFQAGRGMFRTSNNPDTNPNGVGQPSSPWFTVANFLPRNPWQTVGSSGARQALAPVGLAPVSPGPGMVGPRPGLQLPGPRVPLPGSTLPPVRSHGRGLYQPK